MTIVIAIAAALLLFWAIISPNSKGDSIATGFYSWITDPEIAYGLKIIIAIVSVIAIIVCLGYCGPINTETPIVMEKHTKINKVISWLND